ncbi:MAG: hypothetical protein JWP66_247, partial [Naasia sp.]|nr:hypothetical protein [Naasia sp.]
MFAMMAAKSGARAAAAVRAADAAPTPPAAPAVPARTTSISPPGWFGLTAGGVGVGLTAMNMWRDALGSQKGLENSGLFGPTSVAVIGGTGLVLVAEKANITNIPLRNFSRGAGITLVLGGLTGAIAGAFQTFGEHAPPAGTPLARRPVPFADDLPTDVAQLEGLEVAAGEVIDTKRTLHRIPVYVDAKTAERLPDG